MVGLAHDQFANARPFRFISGSATGVVFLGRDYRGQPVASPAHFTRATNFGVGRRTSLVAERMRVTVSSRSTVEISNVRSAAEKDEFIKFPWQIYQDDPAWIPPLIIERRAFLDRDKHPFYRHGDAALFLARRNGRVVGRIMA